MHFYFTYQQYTLRLIVVWFWFTYPWAGSDISELCSTCTSPRSETNTQHETPSAPSARAPTTAPTHSKTKQTLGSCHLNSHTNAPKWYRVLIKGDLLISRDSYILASWHSSQKMQCNLQTWETSISMLFLTCWTHR